MTISPTWRVTMPPIATAQDVLGEFPSLRQFHEYTELLACANEGLPHLGQERRGGGCSEHLQRSTIPGVETEGYRKEEKAAIAMKRELVSY
jgi:hypothetical protein